MSLDRRVVTLVGPILILSGLAYAAAPGFFAGAAGLTTTPAGETDVRAVYGGFQIGLGVFLVWCGRYPTRTLVGLFALGFTIGSVGLMRTLGLLLDGAPNAYHLANLGVEVAIVLLVVAGVARHRRGAG